MASTNHQNYSFRRTLCHLLRFCEFGNDMFVDEVWGRRKVGRKLQRSTTSAENLIPLGSLGARRRERRGAREEKEVRLLRTVVG